MALHPVPINSDGLPSARQLGVARRAQTKTELEVFRYGLGAQAQAQIDQIDSEALDDATRAAMECELGLLDDGLTKAGASPAKAAIVARHVERNVTINDRANRQLGQLLDQERKLLHQHYQERISEALFETELARIRQERATAEKTVSKLQTDYEQLLANLETALKLAANMGHAYALAGPSVRRLLNQAFFEQLRINEEDVTEAVLTEPYQQLLAIDLIEDLETADALPSRPMAPQPKTCKTTEPRTSLWSGVRLVT
jgi:hypothetical protein